jgi:hypothetical protein
MRSVTQPFAVDAMVLYLLQRVDIVCLVGHSRGMCTSRSSGTRQCVGVHALPVRSLKHTVYVW